MEPAGSNESEDQSALTFRSTLFQWHERNGREFVWRQKEYRTPYAAAVAELMLRRTRADQVVGVFVAFLFKYPTLSDAANAEPEEIRRVLYPLGLTWRADSMIAFFRQAYARYGNAMPFDREQLMKLPGVGEYVGAAVEVFAGGSSGTLIDVNVTRVLGRFFDIDYGGEARRRKSMRELAARSVDSAHPAEYHYAILDFAAKVCVAGRPRCERCPFAESRTCRYFCAVVAPETPEQEPPNDHRV